MVWFIMARKHWNQVFKASYTPVSKTILSLRFCVIVPLTLLDLKYPPPCFDVLTSTGGGVLNCFKFQDVGKIHLLT